VSDLVAGGGFTGRRLSHVLIALLACGFLSLGAIEAWRDSPIFDEPVYVSSGLTALRTGELSLNDEHPPLAKVLAVLPVLLVHPVIPVDHGAGSNDEQIYSAAFLQSQIRAGTLRAVDFASRTVPLLESVALALLLYGLGSDLYGAPAGCFCAALWLASPLVLGLGHLDGVDLPFALAVVGFSRTLLRWMRVRSRRRLLILGIAAGIAALTNASGLLLVALGVMVVPAAEIGHGRRRAALAGLTFALTALASIWLVYVALDPATLGAGAGLLPHPYLEGLRYLESHDTSPAASYFAGISWTGGRWWYWPLSLAIKLPPATVAVLLLGPLGLLGLDRATRREVAIVAALPALVLFAFDLSLSRRRALPVACPRAVARGGVRRVHRVSQPGGARRARGGGRTERLGDGRVLSAFAVVDRSGLRSAVSGRHQLERRLGSGPVCTAALGSRARPARGPLRAAWDHACRYRAGRAADRRPARADHRVGGGVGNGSDDRREPRLAARVLPRWQHRRDDPHRSLHARAVGTGSARRTRLARPGSVSTRKA
jgi:hypothetical protein